jgi:hypothetical protein
MPSPRIDENEFKRRFKNQFIDPAFAPLATEVQKITDAAWDANGQRCGKFPSLSLFGGYMRFGKNDFWRTESALLLKLLLPRCEVAPLVRVLS